MHEVQDVDVLQKTILFQSCLIAGHSVEAIFRNEADFVLGSSNADMVALCVEQKDHLQLEFILDKHDIFHQYLRRFHLQGHTLVLDTLRKENARRLTPETKYIQTNSLQNLLIDSMVKNKIKYFEETHKFTQMFSYPLYSLEKQNLIGYLIFCFLDDHEPNMDEMTKIKKMAQTIISPFHDEKTNTFRNRCVQVVTDTPVLTSKERHILKYLLAAKSYAEIAEMMHISVNTVKTHIKHIYAKYEVGSKIELANKINGGRLS